MLWIRSARPFKPFCLSSCRVLHYRFRACSSSPEALFGPAISQIGKRVLPLRICRSWILGETTSLVAWWQCSNLGPPIGPPVQSLCCDISLRVRPRLLCCGTACKVRSLSLCCVTVQACFFAAVQSAQYGPSQIFYGADRTASAGALAVLPGVFVRRRVGGWRAFERLVGVEHGDLSVGIHSGTAAARLFSCRGVGALAPPPSASSFDMLIPSVGLFIFCIWSSPN